MPDPTPMLDAIGNWMITTPIYDFMVNVGWAFAAAETLHFMALTLLLGSLLVVDLRGMGLMRFIPFEQAHKLIPLAIGAFIVNVITGLSFVFSNPWMYFPNLGFWWKMFFILAAGVNALVFELLVFRRWRKGEKAVADSLTAKITSALSLVFWFTVLILGRFLPWTE
jgi:hypothetical protein